MGAWRRGAWLAAAALLVAGLGLLWWPRAPEAVPDAAAVRDSAALAPTALTPPPAAPTAGATPGGVAAGSVAPADSPPSTPPGVSPAQWAQLRAELSARPDGAAELQRLADYFGYADALERFRRLRGERADAASLRPLAQQLDQGLPDRLQRHELSVHDALRIKAAVLEVLVPDASRRQHELALWRQQQQQQQQQASALASGTEDAARNAEFQRRQAALVAAWQALPPAQRDPRALEAQLEALRRASFGTPDR
jgi:hypothetical protein